MVDEKAQYWFEIAQYDLDTARAMLDSGRFLYVGFMCHQVVEKALKGLIARDGTIPPYIHNLSRLAEGSGAFASMDPDQKDLLDSLEPLNIEARYPEDRERLAVEMTAGRGRRMIARTEELYQWIKSRL